MRHDIQLKGSGPTPFSRSGDGRAALGPVLREYIVSEAMAALGVPTTRALAAVTTGETILRQEAHAARRGADARGAEPCAGRHVSSFSAIAATSKRVRTLADYVDRAALSRGGERAALSRAAGCA